MAHLINSLRAAHNVALITLFACKIASAQTSQDQADQLRDLTNQVLARVDGMDKDQSRRGAAVDDAAQFIQQRATVLRDLIQSDPKKAAEMALPSDVLVKLREAFPDQQASFEESGQWHGQIERWVFDSVDLKQSKSVTTLKMTGDSEVELYFAGTDSFKTSTSAAVTGVRIGDRVAVTGLQDATAATVQACSTTGVQNSAVLLVTFPGVTLPSTVSTTSLRDTFFGAGHSLDGYWRDASYGKTSAAGDVYGVLTLDRSYACSEGSLMRAAAIAAAGASGIDLTRYQRLFVVYPNSGCTAGFATVGCSTLNSSFGAINASTTYLTADYMTGDTGVCLAAHEGGHNLGLQHAGTRGFGTEPLGPLGSSGTIAETGDVFSVMGGCGSYLGHYGAPQKASILNWVNYDLVQTAGIKTIAPIGAATAASQALRIQRGTGNNAWLWVEYKQPVGYDVTLGPYGQGFNGALIHYDDGSAGAGTHLLDFSPDGSWDTWWAPALLPGTTWKDPYSDLSLTVQSATGSALTVAVNYSGSACVPASPTVSISPSNMSTTAGSTANYTITLKNNDSAQCAASSFAVGSAQPSGWPTSLSASSVVLTPGQATTISMQKNAPASATSGVYPVDATSTASRSASASASANVTVSSVTPSLAISVSSSGTSFSSRDTVALTATVTSGSAPASGAQVTFTLVTPAGASSIKNVTTDAGGKAVWSYKVAPKNSSGTYIVSAKAVQGTQAVSSSAINFTVK